jgi:glycosyltransferase involved in cell wall biosynthesis
MASRLNNRVDGDVDRVVPISHEENQGVGAAIKTGYRRARDDGVHATAVMAGDGQMEPDELERFLDPIIDGRADYVKGNRLYRRGHWQSMSGWRQFGNRLLTLLTRIASGYWGMSDPQNGYTIISDRALQTIRIDDLFDDYGFANDLLVHLNVNEMRVADVPHEAVYGDEVSDIAYSSFVPQLSMLLLRDFLWRLKTDYLVLNFHPTVLCYALGTVGTVTSIVKGAATFRPGRTSDDAAQAHSDRFLSFAVFLLSSLFFVLALVFDMEQNEDLVVRTEGSAPPADEGHDPTGDQAASDDGSPLFDGRESRSPSDATHGRGNGEQ